MQDLAPPELLDQLAKRVDASLSTKHPRDTWRAYLTKWAPVAGSVADMERSFFLSKGGSGKTLHDILDSYLNSKGYTGTTKDKVNAFCKAASSF